MMLPQRWWLERSDVLLWLPARRFAPAPFVVIHKGFMHFAQILLLYARVLLYSCGEYRVGSMLFHSTSPRGKSLELR